MTPDDYRDGVLPQLQACWEQQCFCASAFYRRLIGFDFRDFGIGPVGLADAEILIDAFVRQRCEPTRELEADGALLQEYRCPSCGRLMTEQYDEFNIHMYRSVVRFVDDLPKADTCAYMIGLYGFDAADFDKITGYELMESVPEYIERITDGA